MKNYTGLYVWANRNIPIKHFIVARTVIENLVLTKEL